MSHRTGEQIFGDWVYHQGYGWFNNSTHETAQQPHGQTIAQFGAYLQNSSPSPEPTPIPGNFGGSVPDWTQQVVPIPPDWVNPSGGPQVEIPTDPFRGMQGGGGLYAQPFSWNYAGNAGFYSPPDPLQFPSHINYGNPSAGGNMQLGGFGGQSPSTGDYGIGNQISPYQDLWSPFDYGGSMSQGGNISSFGGNTSVGQEISPFQDYWSAFDYGQQGNASQGGNIMGGDWSLGDNVPSYNDYGWSPVDYGSQGSMSQGGTDISGFGGDMSLGSDVQPFNDYGWTPADYGNNNPFAGMHGGGSLVNNQPVWNLGNVPTQNLSLRPPSDIPSNPFGYGQTGSYLNGQGQVVSPSGTGFGYSPTAVYNSAGQYIGMNGGNFAGQGSNIGGIMSSGNTWNTLSSGGMQDTTGDGLGGQAVVQGRGEGPAFQIEELPGGHIFHYGGPVPGPTGHQGHLAGKIF